MNAVGQLGNGAFEDSGVATDVVAETVKPTPTPTACPPAGCPTATPRPAPPQTGLDFSLAIDVDGDGINDCGTRTGDQRVCTVSPGDEFEVVLSLDALPPGVPHYEGFDSYLAFAGISSEQKSDVTWPDCGFPATYYDTDFVAFGCAVPPGGITSAYVGPIGESDFSCTRSGSATLVHGAGQTTLVKLTFELFHETGPAADQIAINCGEVAAGDVDCSQAANSMDAALMLQKSATLVEWLGCPQFADVNLDRNDNAVDALLTLQYTAGLVGELPVVPQ
jgi:hypothetical protein